MNCHHSRAPERQSPTRFPCRVRCWNAAVNCGGPVSRPRHWRNAGRTAETFQGRPAVRLEGRTAAICENLQGAVSCGRVQLDRQGQGDKGPQINAVGHSHNDDCIAAWPFNSTRGVSNCPSVTRKRTRVSRSGSGKGAGRAGRQGKGAVFEESWGYSRFRASFDLPGFLRVSEREAGQAGSGRGRGCARLFKKSGRVTLEIVLTPPPISWRYWWQIICARGVMEGGNCTNPNGNQPAVFFFGFPLGAGGWEARGPTRPAGAPALAPDTYDCDRGERSK